MSRDSEVIWLQRSEILQNSHLISSLIRSLSSHHHLHSERKRRRATLGMFRRKKRAWVGFSFNFFCWNPARGGQTSSGVSMSFYKHRGDKSEVVDSCFSALIHVESELNNCIGPLHLQTWPITTVALQQYSLKCTKCVSQKNVQFFTMLKYLQLNIGLCIFNCNFNTIPTSV